MRNEWSLYRITFNTGTTVDIVAPGITVAMAQSVGFANSAGREVLEDHLRYHLADITRVEEVSRSVYVASMKGGDSGRDSVDRIVAAVPSQLEEESGGLSDLVREHP